MTETELRAAIKDGVHGGYLFYGDEDFLKRHYLGEIRRAVLADCPPGLEEMNRITLTLEDGNIAALQSAVMTMPIMAPQLIVEVTPPAPDSLREKERKAICEALSSLPDEGLVLVFCLPSGTDIGTPKKPTSFFRQLCEHLTPVEFPLQTGTRLRRWVERHFAEAELVIPADVCTAMLTRCAPDMTTLVSEIDKLIAYEHSHGMREVRMEDMLLVTSPGLREDAFALANAVLAGDRCAALRALDVYRKRREEPLMVLGALSRVMSELLIVTAMVEGGYEKADVMKALKMHDYKATLYMRAASDFGSPRLLAAAARLEEADRIAKSGQTGYLPLERFICTIPIGSAFKKKKSAEGSV